MTDDRNGELASFAADREEYLRRQQAVRAKPVSRAWTPLRVGYWVAFLTAAALFIGFIVELLTSSDPNGPAPILLPSLIAVCCAIGGWCAIGPAAAETRSMGRRVRNFVIAGVVTAILGPILVPVVIYVGSLIADVISHFI